MSSRKGQLGPRERQSWTTTRCHRLLRPLKTHISALRRQVELESCDKLSDGDPGDGTTGDSRLRGTIQHTYSKRGRRPTTGATEPGSSATGIPKPSQASTSKLVKFTRKHVIQPGEIALPTPVIRRARGCLSSSPLQQPPLDTSKIISTDRTRTRSFGEPRASSSLISALELEMVALRSRISATKFSLYESILRAFHSLLVATAEPTPGAKGVKSFMSMCLRKIPEYIGELEEWERRQAEEEGTKSTLYSSEMSNEVYEAVESALPPGSGCPQLRTLVKAHGTKVLRDAMEEGLLEDVFSITLVKLCSRTKSFCEAEALLLFLLDRSYPKPRSMDSTFDEGRRLAPLKSLRDFAQESGRSQFMLRQLSKLISHQQLHPHWLSTNEFSDIWSGVVKALSGNEVCDDTVSFAAHMIIILSSQAKSTAFSLRPQADDIRSLSQQTLLSAITTVASLSLLRQEAGGLALHHFKHIDTSPASAKVRYIIQTCIYEVNRTRKPRWMRTILQLAAFFTNNSQDGTKAADFANLWDHVTQYRHKKDGRQQYEAATVIISSFAQYCGRGAPEPSHHYMTRFCNRLARAVEADELMTRKLQTDCAFSLAERTNDLRDLVFAESFTATTASGQPVQPTPRRNGTGSSFTGFRWDEGISEWVTATPAVQQQQQQSSTRNAHSLGSDDESRANGDCYANSDGVSDSEDSGKDTVTFRGIRRKRPISSQMSREGYGSTKLSKTSRKRGSAAAGLLGLLSGSEDGETDSNDQQESSQHDFTRVAGTSRHNSRSISQEKRTGVVVLPRQGQHATKRRRVSAATNASTSKGNARRVTLRTFTGMGRDDASEDELGL